MTQTWQFWAFGAAFFAGLTAIFGKIGVTNINSNLATLIRTAVILIICAGTVAVRGEWQRPSTIEQRTWLFLVLSALATGLSWLCYYRALQMGPASRVAPIDKLSVVFAMVLAVVFLGEDLSWRMVAGGVLVVSGVIVLSLP